MASVTLSLSATAEPHAETAGNPMARAASRQATGPVTEQATEQITVQASAQIIPRTDPRIDPRTAGVLEFIGALEAPGGYDAFSHYAAEAPPKPLTSMTVREVLAWQDRIDARSKSEAAGRFQIMEDTLRDYIVPTMGLTGSEIFSAQMQDAMAVVLMRRRGWDPASTDFVRMGNALALEWAALPRLSGTRAGQSVYRNTQSARNRALTTPAIFLSVLENPTSRPAVRHAVQQSRRPRTGHAGRTVRTPRTAGAGAIYISNVSRSVLSVRPASPENLTGGPLSPSRIIVFRIDPYAQE